MKPSRLLAAVVLAVAAFAAVPGCQLNPPTPAVQLTPEQQQARTKTTVRVAASLTTRDVLLALGDKGTATAKIVNAIAGDVLAFTVNDQLSLEGIHDLAVKHIADIKATAQEKLIALQIVDSVAAIFQANTPTDATANPNANIRLVCSAAIGCKDATVIFVH